MVYREPLELAVGLSNRPPGLLTGGPAASALLDRVVAAALSSLAPNTCRVYKARIQLWRSTAPKPLELSRESIKRYIRQLELSGATAQTINQTLAALKRLASEAAELSWLDHQTAAQIERIKGRKIRGVRSGRWLNLYQVKALIASIERTTLQGKRDAAVIALLIGCGVRRAEACDIAVYQVDRSHDRTIIKNIVGKGGRTRSVAVPGWTDKLLVEWVALLAVAPAGAATGLLLRSLTSNGTINGSLSPSAIRDIVRYYGALIGVPDLNPHDLRRTYAKLSRTGGAPLETIQKSLGHASLKTTEVYLATGEEANAGDYIKL